MLASHALRTCMLGLVLIDLLFVQLTDAAELAWLLPLYALTLLAPVLQPLRRFAPYRLGWNLAVIGLFAMLVSHAAGHDLRFVLQDGLLLAALCQVHLLNNLGEEQRPDLLFLNSFLIAVATGYLSQDLIYPVAFLIYVPLLLIGLQLLSVTRDGRELDTGTTRRVVVDGLWRSGVLVVLTLAVFLFWPRDFHRRSLLAGEFDFTSPSESVEIAFSDELKLQRRGASRVSDRVVMTVELLQGASIDVPTLWRGAALDATDGREWWSSPGGDFARGQLSGDTWIQRGSQLVRPDAADQFDTRLAVELVDLSADRLFAPLVAERVVTGRGVHADRVRAGKGGVLKYGDRSQARTPAQYEVKYTVRGPRASSPSGPVAARVDPQLARYVALPRSHRVRSARNLAERLASELPPDVEQHELVQAFSDYLERKYAYLPPGAEGAAQTLDQFLAGASGGHCELFASALATMLRSRSVPCRVVTGYRSAEWDATQETLTFRSRGAHAWVEVLDPTAGWYTVDPNPAPASAQGPSWIARTRLALSTLWGKLAGFDAERRGLVLAWVRGLPGRLADWARREPGRAASSALALGLGLALLRLRARRRMGAELFAYRRALARARMRLEPGETPRELLQRASGLDLAPPIRAALAEATRMHERARYGVEPTRALAAGRRGPSA